MSAPGNRVRPNWFCVQAGAREHYAVPRALHQLQQLSCLVTDAWVHPDSLYGLPLSCLAGRLQERFHSELKSANVIAFTASLLAFRVLNWHLRGWDLVLAHNSWFQRRVVHALTHIVTRCEHAASHAVLFIYSYAALEVLRWAKAHNWITVLCQIDPGPRMVEIVADELLRYPSIATVWKPPPQALWAKWHEECEIADIIIANSEWSRNGLALKGVPIEKIHVVPLIYDSSDDGTTLSKRYPDRFSVDRPLRVLFLGQVSFLKGVARMLDAARRLREEPIEWTIVGAQELRSSIMDRGLTNLRWIGPVHRGEVGRYYREADVLLFPTLSDGFGLTQLEAQSHMLPIIASKNCGKVVRHEENGFLLPEVSVEAIEASLRECLRNPARLAAMSARSHVAAQFSPVSVASQLLELAEGARKVHAGRESPVTDGS